MSVDPNGESFFGILSQIAISVECYIGMVLLSIIDENIRGDMKLIGWNPFNSNEALTMDSTKVSFYKGVPVFRTNSRSGSFYAIFMDREDSFGPYAEDDLRHEYGHSIQLMKLGPVKYGFGIGVPSWLEFTFHGPNDMYTEQPWEITADIFGGVESRYHITSDISKAYWYFSILGML
ncbi:MAG: hypothetical protein C4537_07895 [Acholeplasma sp.]|nr:MAG: hypothetical protein C4537_07895 [Acholeplasma sp.]